MKLLRRTLGGLFPIMCCSEWENSCIGGVLYPNISFRWGWFSEEDKFLSTIQRFGRPSMVPDPIMY